MSDSVVIRPTMRQKQLLQFIAEFIAEHGYSPSYREIMRGCGYTSVATVALHVNCTGLDYCLPTSYVPTRMDTRCNNGSCI